MEVTFDKVECYLDDTLLMSYSEPQNFFSIAGRDKSTGDVIVKVVNASAHPYQTSFQLNGLKAAPMAELITLKSDSPEDENSFLNLLLSEIKT